MANVPVITEPDWDGKTPYSRSEAILLSIINGTPIDTEKWEGIPLSRGEYLLLQLKDVIEDNSMLDFKGRVDSVDDLPSTGNKKGDVYSVGSESQLNRPEYFWTGTTWEYFGQIVDLSGYATLQEVQTAINAAVNSLTAMVEGTYLPLTGGVIRNNNQVTDSGKIFFKVDGYTMGFIGMDTSNNLAFETFGKSLSLTNTGDSFDILTKSGPLTIGTQNTNAPIYIKSYGSEIIKVTNPNEFSMTTHGNNTIATRFDHNDGKILMGAIDEISIASPKSVSLEKGDNTGAWLVVDNETNPKVRVGLGSTEFVNVEASGTHFHTPIYSESVIYIGSGGTIYANTQTGITVSSSNNIEFVTDSGPFTKMINTVGARHWTAGLGATTFIDLDGSTGRVIANQPLRAKSSVLTSVISMIDPTSQTEASIGQITASSSGISINGSSVSIAGASISLYGSSISIGGGSILLNNNPLCATVLLTQAEYDALETKDPNVVYNIYEPDEEEGE